MNYRAKRKWGELVEIVETLPPDSTKTDLFDCVVDWLKSMRKIMGQDRFQKEVWQVWRFDDLVTKTGADYPVEFSEGTFSEFRSRISDDTESVTMGGIAMSISYLLHDLMMFEVGGCEQCGGYGLWAYFDRKLDTVVLACSGFCDYFVYVDGRPWDGADLMPATLDQLRRSGLLTD